MGCYRFQEGDKVRVREDLDPEQSWDIEVCDIDDLDVVDHIEQQDCVGRYALKYIGQEMTICYVEADVDDGRVWYACEESGGYVGMWDTNWWPAGAFEECNEGEPVVEINAHELMSLLGT